MIAVSDTSPINYLVLIELHHLLPELFGRVFVPDAVHLELRSHGAPEAIGRFLAKPPNWLEIRSAPPDATLRGLDAGEREAISLALAVGADLVLMDERKGRQVAREKGLRVSGTIGVIHLAADRKLVRLQDALERLANTNFRVSPRLLSRLQGGTDRG
jgi:predicted nucleic acid-binding protein